MSTNTTTWVVATDGSVDPIAGLGAYAWVAADGTCGVNVEPGLSSTTAELAAVEAALAAAPLGITIQLLVDHQPLVNALRAVIRGETVAWPCMATDADFASRWDRVADALAGRSVGVNWVRSHAKNRQNRRVDSIARSALRAARRADTALAS